MTQPPRLNSGVTPRNGDRFDRVKRTSRVGAHRAVEKSGTPGAWFIIATLITLILTAVGILLFTLQPGSISFMDQLRTDGKSPVTIGPMKAEIDPDTTVVVLNGTENDALAFAVDEAINAEGWGKTLYAGNASDRDIKISAVFYSDPADQAVARGLGEKLGGISFYENPNYATHNNQLTVLLGADYSGPGLEEVLSGMADSDAESE